jgi:hypothetical protein
LANETRIIFQARADPNAADLSGEPPLIEAACAGDVEVKNFCRFFGTVSELMV